MPQVSSNFLIAFIDDLLSFAILIIVAESTGSTSLVARVPKARQSGTSGFHDAELVTSTTYPIMYQLSPEDNLLLLKTSILSGTSKNPFPHGPLLSIDMACLLRAIAMEGQTLQRKTLYEPFCERIAYQVIDAVRKYQVIRDDLQKAYEEKDFSDVLNAGVCFLISPGCLTSNLRPVKAM